MKQKPSSKMTDIHLHQQMNTVHVTEVQYQDVSPEGRLKRRPWYVGILADNAFEATTSARKIELSQLQT